MAAHSQGVRAIPPVSPDQAETGTHQWLRDMAQSINLISGWVGTATAPGGSGTVTSVTAGTGLTGSPNPIVGAGSIALSVPVSVANGGTGATTVAAGPWVQKAGDTMSGTLVAPKVTARGSGAASQIGVEFRNDTGPATVSNGGLWRAAVGASGNFNVQVNTAAAGDFATATQPLQINPTSGDAAFSGTLYAPTVRTGLTTSGSGVIGLTSGSTTTTGYIEWFLPAGSRQAYMGFHQNYLLLSTEQGGHLRVQGVGNAGIQLNNTAQTANITMFNDGNGHISSTAGLYLNWLGNQTVTTGGTLDIYGTGKLNIHSTYFAEADGAGVGYNKLYSAAGNLTLHFGSGSDQTNYHRQTSHKFQDVAGTFEIAMFNTTATYNRSGAWVVFSGAELKQDIEPFERGLDAVAGLRPVTFRYQRGVPFADPAPDGGKPLLGFLAHEAGEHFPEIVGEAKIYQRGTVKTTSPGLLIFPVVNALKEIKQRLEALEAKLG